MRVAGQQCIVGLYVCAGLLLRVLTSLLFVVVLVVRSQVSMGDEGLSQCAGKCDTAPGCVAYSMTEAGACTMLKDINVSVAGQSF